MKRVAHNGRSGDADHWTGSSCPLHPCCVMGLMAVEASETLRRCTRSLARPAAAGTSELLPWSEFCDPGAGRLLESVRAWQRLGGFDHHRAGTVLVAFRASWLALCATVPEYHLGLDVPPLARAHVIVGASGVVDGLVLPDRPPAAAASGEVSASSWWRTVSGFVAPLTRSLAAVGGPAASSDQYWGNAVGLIGEVLRRIAAHGAGGNVLATAAELRSATGRADLLDLRGEAGGLWSRRRTCCQLWRSGTGYCTECVLHDSPSRRQA